MIVSLANNCCIYNCTQLPDDRRGSSLFLLLLFLILRAWTFSLTEKVVLERLPPLNRDSLWAIRLVFPQTGACYHTGHAHKHISRQTKIASSGPTFFSYFLDRLLRSAPGASFLHSENFLLLPRVLEDAETWDWFGLSRIGWSQPLSASLG